MIRFFSAGKSALVLGAVLWLNASGGSAQVVTLAEEGDLLPLLADAVDDPAVDEPAAPAPVAGQAMALRPRAIAESDNAPEREVIRERYPNREMKIEREVTQDSEGNYHNDGSWKMFNPGGELIAEGEYRRGQRHGLWTMRRGQSEAELFKTAPYNQFTPPFVSQAIFDHGQLSGAWTIFDSQQRMVSQWNFEHGKRHGKSTWYYPSGRTMREIDYRDGTIDGAYTQWNPEGRATLREQYREGRKVITKVDYQGDDQKKSEGVYLQGKLLQETADDWWNSKPAAFTAEAGEERNGLWTAWYPNGQMQVQGNYKQDLQWGKFTWWYADGQKQAEGEYVAGKPHGSFVWWHSNGQKHRHGHFTGGFPSGVWHVWEANGRLVGKEDHTSPIGAVSPPASAPAPAAEKAASETSKGSRRFAQ